MTLPEELCGCGQRGGPSKVEGERADDVGEPKPVAWLTDAITKLGLKVTPSAANFVLINFPDTKTADDADEFLTKRGLILRGLKNYGLPNALRMTVGLEEPNRLVVEALRDFLKQA